jgi:hypothetical protein
MIKFEYDGKNLGSIDNLIIYKHYSNLENESETLLSKVDLKIEDKEITLSLVKYKNDFALILDELKEQFKVCATYYNIILIDDVKYLAFKNLNEITFKEFKEKNSKNIKYYIESIRRIFVFNWLMVGNDNTLSLENKILVRPCSFSKIQDSNMISPKNSILFFITINDNSYLSIKESHKYDISKSIVKEWFEGSMELFYDYVGRFLETIDVSKFRDIALKVVRKYNSTYTNWVNIVYERLMNSKIYIDKYDSENSED